MERVLCPVTVQREAEIRELEAALEAARAGAGATVVLTGEPGLGKTRLANDLAAEARESRVPVIWGGCAEARLSLPYLPFLEAIGNHLAQVDVDEVRDRLGSGHDELGRLFAQLAPPAPHLAPSDELQGRLRLFEGVLSLLNVFSQPYGLLVVLENMHWADAASRELLEFAVRRLRGSRILLLVTCRPDGGSRRDSFQVTVEGWRRGLQAQVIELPPLPPEGVGRMLSAMFGVESVGAEAQKLLHERSEGNPYALEEILKEALDRGTVTRQQLTDRSGWRDLPRLRLPRTVRDSVLSRLEELPEELGDVVRCASVLGRSFDYPLLLAVAGREPSVVRSTLKTCVDSQLLEEDTARDGFFQFRHALTRQAVYEDLLAPQREELHAAAAEALKRRSSVPAIELCHHLLAARRDREAVPLALEAAEQAERTHAYRGAAALYERVLPFIDDQVFRGRLYCRAGVAFLLQGDAARAERHLREGVRSLERLGETRTAAAQRLWLGRCYSERGRADLAIAEYETARARLEEEGPSGELALAYARLASLAAYQLDGERTVEMARRAVDIGCQASADVPRIMGYMWLGLGHVQLDEPDAGIEYLDLSYREAVAAGLDFDAANALYNSIIAGVQVYRPLETLERLQQLQSLEAGTMARGFALRGEGFLYLWGLGQPERALRALEGALELAREGDQSRWVAWSQIQLALTLGELDRLDDAKAILPDRSDTSATTDWRAPLLYAEVRLALDGGRHAAATESAEEALAATGWPLRTRLYVDEAGVEALLAKGRAAEAGRVLDRLLKSGAAPDHPYVRQIRGRIALAAGSRKSALRELRAAAEFWLERGFRSFEARARLVIAEGLMQEGAVDAAQDELRSVLRSAEPRHAALEARLAREALARLGARVVTPEIVRDALEHLHRPEELGDAALVRLLGLDADGGGGRLRELLSGHVEALATSADGREREAGRLLQDYYVKRVGSQETVADRLHLTRATFYRRLHLGWELLGERLTGAGSA